jgi:hypothetical protein
MLAGNVKPLTLPLMNGLVFNSLLNQFNRGIQKSMNMGVSAGTTRELFTTQSSR